MAKLPPSLQYSLTSELTIIVSLVPTMMSGYSIKVGVLFIGSSGVLPSARHTLVDTSPLETVAVARININGRTLFIILPLTKKLYCIQKDGLPTQKDKPSRRATLLARVIIPNRILTIKDFYRFLA
jgi:hypothetical protein